MAQDSPHLAESFSKRCCSLRLFPVPPCTGVRPVCQSEGSSCYSCSLPSSFPRPVPQSLSCTSSPILMAASQMTLTDTPLLDLHLRTHLLLVFHPLQGSASSWGKHSAWVILFSLLTLESRGWVGGSTSHPAFPRAGRLGSGWCLGPCGWRWVGVWVFSWQRGTLC